MLELELPVRIGVGLAALGRPGYINLGHAEDLEHSYDVEAMEARAHRVLDAAWAAGARYFDAARSYGRAEEFLGNWLRLRGRRPEDAVVGSKWGYTYTAGWSVRAQAHEVKEHTLAVLRRQIAESGAQLGAHLDLYQIHSATMESGVLDDRGVLEELARLRDAGLAVGLSVSGARQGDVVRRALGIEIGGRRLFDAVQATWNLLEPSAGAALAEARAAGLAVIVKEGLANGRLTQRNLDRDFAPRREILGRVVRRHGCSLDALALAAALAQPWASIVLSGAATLPHLESNLSAVRVAWSEDDAAELRGIAEAAEEYWAKRASLPWN